jgi:hypothetical protein
MKKAWDLFPAFLVFRRANYLGFFDVGWVVERKARARERGIRYTTEFQ